MGVRLDGNRPPPRASSGGQAGRWETVELSTGGFFLSRIRSKNMVGARRQERVLVFSGEGWSEKGTRSMEGRRDQ